MQPDEQILQIQRDINCLLDEDRNIRRQGLNKLNDFFKISHECKILIFEKYVVKNLLRAFDDKIEKNREIAYNILQSYLNIPRNVEITNDLAEIIIKLLVQRLNQIPFPENSEELRLTIIKLLSQFLLRSQQSFMSLLPEYSNMLYKVLMDQYPEMKKVASDLCAISSEHLKKYIGGYFLNVVKQLSVNMSHQHSRVRKVSVEALSSVLLCEGSGAFLEFALPSLKVASQDKSSEVRKACLLTITKLLQGMSVVNLGLFENKLYLMLLNGLSDESLEIQQQTLVQIEDVGRYRKEFERELGNYE